MGAPITPVEILERVVPFKFLSQRRRRQVADLLVQCKFTEGEHLFSAGTEDERQLYFVAGGVAEAIDESKSPPEVLGKVLAGHYAGEHAALFESHRELTVRAATPVVAYRLSAPDFLQLVDEVPAFAQGLGNILKVKQGIFRQYQAIYAQLLTSIHHREFLLSELLPRYRDLQPALHMGLTDRRVDCAALSYAVARLPATLTETTHYFLTTELPLLYRDPDSKFEAIPTRSRRRSTWKALPGKSIVLLRDGISDITDLLTCLCVYAIEAKKIRDKVSSGQLLKALRRTPDPDPEEEQQLAAMLDLSAEEVSGLRSIWPTNFWAELRNMLLHHEDIAIDCDFQPEAYNSTAAEVWLGQIREAASGLVDMDDPELDVHIVSSNTHSVGNCLSPYLRKRRDEILAWGRTHHPEVEAGGHWDNPSDLMYVYAQHWFAENRGARKQADQEEHAAGRHRIATNAYTGISVDLFDASRLLDELTDDQVRVVARRERTLIVNIDYAFGQQAEQILSSLLFLFGRRIRSINVLGKAGGLVGARGDLLLPSATLQVPGDELYQLPNTDLSADELQKLAPGRTVHRGPVLTVAGTLLQDRRLLHFYRRIWKSVGLEMEGSFYARTLLRAMCTGVLRDDVVTRFAYYISDLPLGHEANLSLSLAPEEGVPPLYAVTRATLNRVLAS